MSAGPAVPSGTRLGKIAAPKAAAAELPSGCDAYALAVEPAAAVDVAAVARDLPDADALPAGTLVVMLPGGAAPSLTTRLLAALGRGKAVPRALRSSALVARGYVRVAAAPDETLGDLVWGYVPGVAGKTPADAGDDAGDDGNDDDDVT